MRMVVVRHLRLALVGLALAGYSGQAQTESSADPVIEQARQAAVTYAQSLLRYTVQRTTKRYLEVRSARISGVHYTGCIAAVPGANQADCEQRPPDTWGMLDVVTADVVTDHGHEVSLNLRVNDAPATEADVGRGGYWGEGDFDGALEAILAPASAGWFTKTRSGTLAKRPAWRYEYSIDHAHSEWHLSQMSMMRGTYRYAPAFGGAIWTDRETSRVLRVEMHARDLPDGFPMDRVQWAIDYDFVKVCTGNYLLPKHSQLDNCPRNIDKCSCNVTDFKNYREYVADTSISFGDGK